MVGKSSDVQIQIRPNLQIQIQIQIRSLKKAQIVKSGFKSGFGFAHHWVQGILVGLENFNTVFPTYIYNFWGSKESFRWGCTVRSIFHPLIIDYTAFCFHFFQAKEQNFLEVYSLDILWSVTPPMAGFWSSCFRSPPKRYRTAPYYDRLGK